MRRALATLAVLACTAAAASGCGGGDSSSPPGSGSSAAPKVIQVTFSGDSVTPNGDRVEVKVGQPIEFVVKADTEGEIHVHSDPEKELEYGAGTTTLPAFTIDKTIVQLEVR